VKQPSGKSCIIIFLKINIIIKMPIIFISLSELFTEKIKQYGFDAKTMGIRHHSADAHER
jgi:hypothetical protein